MRHAQFPGRRIATAGDYKVPAAVQGSRRFKDLPNGTMFAA
jgi:hypothetical protein